MLAFFPHEMGDFLADTPYICGKKLFVCPLMGSAFSWFTFSSVLPWFLSNSKSI